MCECVSVRARVCASDSTTGVEKKCFYNRISFILSVDKIAFLFPHLGLWSVETKIDYDGIKTKGRKV